MQVTVDFKLQHQYSGIFSWFFLRTVSTPYRFACPPPSNFRSSRYTTSLTEDVTGKQQQHNDSQKS